MISEREHSLMFWRKELDEKGARYLRQVLPSYHGSHQHVGYEVLSKYEENLAHTRHEELRILAVKSLDAQRDGNGIQTKILWALLATIVFAVLIAILRE